MKTLNVIQTIVWALILGLIFSVSAQGASISSPRIYLESTNDHSIVLQLESPAIDFDSAVSGGLTWDVPFSNGAGRTSEIGAPALPLLSRLILLDADDSVSVEVDVIESVVYENLDIIPVQPPAFRDGREAPKFELNEDIYTTDALWPAQVANAGRPAIMHGNRFASLKVTPLRYNPVTGQAVLATKARIRITLNDGNDNTVPYDSPGSTRVFQQILDNLYSGPEKVDRKDATEAPVDGAYLIITDAAYLEYAQDLAAWKSRKGLQVEVYTTAQAGGTASKIKSFLSDRYYAGDLPVDYVLLFGDVDQVPTFKAMDGTANDHEYATLEGSDYLPDVIIGRLPVDSLKEAEIAVAKMVGYETAPQTSTSGWFKSALMISGSDANDDNNAIDTGNIFSGDGNFSNVDYLFGSEGTNTLDNVLGSLDQGVSWITYYGHGSKRSWKSISPAFDNGDVQSLNRNGVLPVITSIACSNGAFDAASDSFAETWINTDANSGAAAIFAAGGQTPFYYTDSLGKGVAEGYFQGGILPFGAAAVYAKMKMYTDFPEEAGGYTELVMQQFHVFADPELNVWSARPKELEVGVSNVINDTVTVTVDKNGAPFPGARVHIYNYNGLSVVATADVDGIVELQVPNGLDREDFEVTVTGKNAIPFTTEEFSDDDSDDDDQDADDYEDDGESGIGCGL